jgi:hypothetical protein
MTGDKYIPTISLLFVMLIPLVQVVVLRVSLPPGGPEALIGASEAASALLRDCAPSSILNGHRRAR